MLKRIAIALVFNIALVGAIVFMARYYQVDSGGCALQGQQETQSAQPAPGTAQPSGDNTHNSKPKPQWWLVLIAWPLGITTWAIIFTLEVITWQSFETYRSARALRGELKFRKRDSVRGWLSALR